MVGINGISTQVMWGEDSLKISEDGCLGKLDDHLPLRLKVTIGPEAGNFLVVTVDGKKNIIPKEVKKSGGNLTYKLTIPVRKSEDGEFFTPYPQNNLRLLKLDPNGQFQIWEIAVISQHGKFFLTTQKTIGATCYRDGGNVTMPAVKWPQLLTFLQGRLKPDNLPLIAQYRRAPAQVLENLSSNEGLVLWFNIAQGIGAIVTGEGIVRVHWSEINRGNGYHLQFLKSGERIKFTHLQKLTHTGKNRPTKFGWEVHGVRLTS